MYNYEGFYYYYLCEWFIISILTSTPHVWGSPLILRLFEYFTTNIYIINYACFRHCPFFCYRFFCFFAFDLLYKKKKKMGKIMNFNRLLSCYISVILMDYLLMNEICFIWFKFPKALSIFLFCFNVAFLCY